MTNSTVDNRLAVLLREGRALLGFYYGYPAEGIVETLRTGWDFIWIDGQHGQLSFDGVMRAVRTASSLELETVVRVPTHDPGLLAQYADTAASAVMVPQVGTASVARGAVEALRFPPLGNRSFGGRRPIDVHGRDYYRRREPLIVIQIESRDGLENVESIAAVEGVDVLFFGADDLKLSLELPLDTVLRTCDVLLEAQQRIAVAALAAGKSCGIVVADPRDLRASLELGYQLISYGSDIGFLQAGSRRALEEGRPVLEQAQTKVTVRT